MTARIGRRFADAPRMISFSLDAKDVDVWTGDPVNVQTDLIVQAGGGFPFLPYQLLTAQEGKNNFQFKALEHTYGPALPGDEDAEDPDVRVVYINGDNHRLNNRNLRDLYEDVFGTGTLDPALDVRFIFETNSVSGSSVQTDAAVETGSWPELTTPILIDCRGLIAGKGGNGASIGGTPQDGGVALELNDDIRLNNTGIIGGGGAGVPRAAERGERGPARGRRSRARRPAVRRRASRAARWRSPCSSTSRAGTRRGRRGRGRTRRS